EQRDQQRRRRKKRRMEQERNQRDQQQLDDCQEEQDDQHLPHVDRRARRGGEEQRPQRFRIPLPLEGPPERERAGELDRDPQDPGGGVLDRLPLLHERDREHQHARQREQQRRVQDLPALDLDRDILAEDQERGAQEHVTRSRWRYGNGREGPLRRARRRPAVRL